MIKLVYDVEKYRRVLAETVGEGDVVVEIGPHTAQSTDCYVKMASKAVLVDKGVDCTDSLSEYAQNHENVSFICGDARDFDTITLTLNHVSSADVLAVDLGGGRFPDTVFKVWCVWSGILKPRDSIIRCRALIEFLRRVEDGDDTLPETFADNGWLSDFGRSTPIRLKQQLKEFKYWVDLDESK